MRQCSRPAPGTSAVYSVPQASRIWKKQREEECILLDVRNPVFGRRYPSRLSQGKAYSGLRSEDVRGEDRLLFGFLKDEENTEEEELRYTLDIL